MKSDHKTHVRLQIKSLFDEHSLSELNTFSDTINVKLLEIIDAKKIRNIAVFAPTEDEPNIWPIISQKGKSDKAERDFHFYFPRINSDDELEFVHVTSKEQLKKGKYGILEPIHALPAIDLSILDAVLVPGLAFSEDGKRLGRGKGYYDKFLSKLPPTTIRIGVCFAFQLLYVVPVEEHDQKVDVVVS